MIPYWLFFLVPVLGVFFQPKSYSRIGLQGCLFVFVFFVLVIGLRHQVGGDWSSYVRHFNNYSQLSFSGALGKGDVGYFILNWFSARLGGNIYVVNLFCASLLMMGVVRFSNAQPLPWLALAVSVPYLVIVVGMGYTRQSAALGCLLMGLVELRRESVNRFIFWVIVGAAFHKSAVLMLPLAAVSATRSRYWKFFWVGIVSLAGAYFFVFDSADRLWENYVEADLHSQGGFIRVLMNAFPACIFIAFRRRLAIDARDERLWYWVSIFSLACVPLVFVSSTATDRVALYLIPIQMYVFSRVHLLFKRATDRAAMVAGVLFFYAAVLFVWLVFAKNSIAWLPYQMFPFAS